MDLQNIVHAIDIVLGHPANSICETSQSLLLALKKNIELHIKSELLDKELEESKKKNQRNG